MVGWGPGGRGCGKDDQVHLTIGIEGMALGRAGKPCGEMGKIRLFSQLFEWHTIALCTSQLQKFCDV